MNGQQVVEFAVGAGVAFVGAWGLYRLFIAQETYFAWILPFFLIAVFVGAIGFAGGLRPLAVGALAGLVVGGIVFGWRSRLLHRAYQSKLWRASETVPGPADPWAKKATPMIVGVWFAILVADSVVGRLASRASFDTVEQVLQAAWLTVTFDALGALTALVALCLVAELDERLRISETRLAQAPAPVAVFLAV